MSSRTKYSIFAFRIFLLLLLGLAPNAFTAPWDVLEHRSVSRSHQFIIYSDDPNARAEIAMAAEDAKDKFLKLLDTNDGWKHPIIIQLKTPDTADPSEPTSDVRIVNTQDGFKVAFTIVLGDNPRAAHFPQQLIRALLLEYAYRDQPPLAGANSYADPPSWLMDGMASLAADPDPGAGSDLFRSLIESGKTPTLATFLSENPETLDTPSSRLYSACSMSFVHLLVDLPGGHARMQDFIRHWPGPNADPEVELLKAFPALNSGGQSLEKWWTLGLAGLSARDRYQGLSFADTCQRLDDTLKFNVQIDKSGTTKSFILDQYPAFKNAPGASSALHTLAIRLLGLQAQASPLMREVVGAYQTIAVELSHHKGSHLKTRLAALVEYQHSLTQRLDQIADYLNWYEATQRTEASGSFDEYIRTADQLEKNPATARDDPISKYMDSVEDQLAQ